MHAEEIGLLLKQERGQFLEFVSAYEYRRGGRQKKRDEELAREIVRVLSGMANADGGTVLVGVEPDRSVTGIPHGHDELQNLIEAPQTLLTPALAPATEKVRLGNLLLIRFEVASAFEVYRVTGARSFYRIATETPALPAEQIQNLREAKRSILYERQQPLEAQWDDLDQADVQDFKARIQDIRDLKRCSLTPTICWIRLGVDRLQTWPGSFFSLKIRRFGTRVAASTSSNTKARSDNTAPLSTS